MKNAYLATLTTIAALGIATDSAWALPPDCNAENATTYIGPDGGFWDDPNNWSGNVLPDSGKIVCIPPGQTADKTVIIRKVDGVPTQAHAQKIWISRQDTLCGKVQINNMGNSLRLYATAGESWIDGDLQVEYPSARLIASGSVVITGNGGMIHAAAAWNNVEPVIVLGEFISTIETSGVGAVLTLRGNDNGSPSTSLVVHGNFDIQAELVNNAYVIADNQDVVASGRIHSFGDLLLTTNPKSGSGFWIAESNTADGTAGHLRVEVAVTGTGTWSVLDDGTSAIIVNTAVTHAGPVQLFKGKLHANANFITTGNLQMQSIGGSSPWIEAANGVVVRFSGAP